MRKREESKITVHTNLKEATFRGEYGDMAIVSASTSSAHSYLRFFVQRRDLEFKFRDQQNRFFFFFFFLFDEWVTR